MIYLVTVNPEICTGCKVCEVACSLHHFGECRPEKSRIRVVRWEQMGLSGAVPVVCQQCVDLPCKEACQFEAIVEDGGPSRKRILVENCTGCGACITACPIAAIRMDADKGVVISCDQCGGNPKCVPLCHAGALAYVPHDPGDETHGTGHTLKALKALYEE